MSDTVTAPPPPPRMPRSRAFTREVWAERLARFPDSGLTPAQFCALEAISSPSFYAWRRRLGAPAPDPVLYRSGSGRNDSDTSGRGSVGQPTEGNGAGPAAVSSPLGRETPDETAGPHPPRRFLRRRPVRRSLPAVARGRRDPWRGRRVGQAVHHLRAQGPSPPHQGRRRPQEGAHPLRGQVEHGPEPAAGQGRMQERRKER